MKSNHAAYTLYEVARRLGHLEGTRVLVNLVCAKGHNLGEVRRIDGQRVVVMRQRQQYPAVSPEMTKLVQDSGYTHVVRGTRPMVLVDLLDDDDPQDRHPVLHGECGCRAPAVAKEWLRDTCDAVEAGRHSRRVVVRR